MRFLLASAVSNSHSTGMGKWSHRVAEALRADGHDVTLWFVDDVLGDEPSTFAVVMVYPVRLALAILRRRHEFDVAIIHEPGGFWYGLMHAIVPSLPPLVAMCHNVESKWFRQRLRAAERGLATVPWTTRVKVPLFRTWQSNGTIRLADHVVCLSAEDRGYLIAELGRNGDEITRVANGVAPEDFVLPAGRRGRRLLFVGGWVEVKGARLLPVVFRKVREKLPDAQLTIAGSGMPAEVVIEEFGAGDRAAVSALAGALDATALRALYQSHDVFFMPSLSEGSPLSLLEAMAAGCPVVAAQVGGVPDILRDGTDGLMFPANDADQAAARLVTLLDAPELAGTFGRAARQRAKEFTWKLTAEGLERAAAAVLDRQLLHA
jgi:glycosyltransferase involved in cell wall biosynthesis